MQRVSERLRYQISQRVQQGKLTVDIAILAKSSHDLISEQVATQAPNTFTMHIRGACVATPNTFVHGIDFASYSLATSIFLVLSIASSRFPLKLLPRQAQLILKSKFVRYWPSG